MTGSLTIYHNPNCSKSREAKSHLEELAEQKKFELKVVEYLNGSLTDDEVKDILGFLVKGKKANEDEKEVYAKVLRDNTKELSTPEDVLAGLEDDRSNLQRPIIVNWDTQKAVVCRVSDLFH
jgi:arsenate reductase